MIDDVMGILCYVIALSGIFITLGLLHMGIERMHGRRGK